MVPCPARQQLLIRRWKIAWLYHTPAQYCARHQLPGAGDRRRRHCAEVSTLALLNLRAGAVAPLLHSAFNHSMTKAFCRGRHPYYPMSVNFTASVDELIMFGTALLLNSSGKIDISFGL